MSQQDSMDAVDRLIAEGRARRHRERTELAKMVTAEATEQEALLAKCAEFDAQIAKIEKRLAENEKLQLVLQKQLSAAAIQPRDPTLNSWSAERLAAALARMSPDELAKLCQ